MREHEVGFAWFWRGPASTRQRVARVQPRCQHQSFRARYGGQVPDWVLNRLEMLGFENPTEVQEEALDVLMNEPGTDVVIHAKTGSGKTLAYLIPIFSTIDPFRASLQAAIVVPTPELGIQVYRAARRIAAGWESGERSSKKLVVLPLLEKADLRRQKLQIRESGPRLVIGTVQRMIELEKAGRLKLDLVSMLVVDEFDSCLADIETTSLLRQSLQLRAEDESQRTTILASATVPQHRHFLRTCVKEKWTKASVKHIWIDSDEKIPESIEHLFAVCDPSRKLAALCRIIKCLKPSAAIAFVSPSRDLDVIAKQLTKMLKAKDGSVVALTWDSALGSRKQSMASFRSGEATLLVATDVAARGLDIPHVTHVINIDLPPDSDTYLHRAGRTGRLDRAGTVCSICGPKELFVVDRMSNTLDIELKRLSSEQLTG
eukprot:CAMPEP_0184745804 /NCGR_PEP_ID=MMETSP0315-20130426/8487_1 /TAXON_ID=101924 /ORGANISM="Rhodosorus marinus, Strain UTEX LB 2760" /LENGTH=430 /DNA_ID=CAMNT_0027218165 /DNA_START=124 /DNA_END=1416 /DNA_ORIENTATION=+